jgi:hypothetical protein
MVLCASRIHFGVAWHLRFGELKRLGARALLALSSGDAKRSILSQTFDPHGSWLHRCGIEPGRITVQVDNLSEFLTNGGKLYANADQRNSHSVYQNNP